MESPPKRLTRARAAAKVTSGTVKTTKIVTAASKAKSAAASTVNSKTTKRKTRSDDDEAELDPEDKPSPPKKAARGRPKKAVPEEQTTMSAPATRSTRTARTAKPTTTARSTATEADPAPARATRGRPRKAAQPKPAKPTEPAFQSKPIHSRATTATKPGTKSTATATTQSAMKKTVKFQEPDKENLGPAVKKEVAPTGLRGRPVKKRGPAPASKASTQKAGPSDKKPLSPKKVTQVPVCRDYESEDELAGGGYTPTIKALQRSPVKPPTKAHSPPPADELQEADAVDPDSTMQVNEAILNPPNLGLTTLASPARRMPASPFKDSMRSPARKVAAVSFPGSALGSANNSSGQEQPTPFKSSLLQSSAKRPPSPIKGLQLGAGQTPQKAKSPSKASMFQSPAKRAMPGMKPLLESRSAETDHVHGSPARERAMQPSQFAERCRPSEKLLLGEDGPDGAGEDDFDELLMKPLTGVQFSGRLSAVLPRDVDPDDDGDLLDSEEHPATPSHAPVTAPDHVDEVDTELDGIPVSEPNKHPSAEEMGETAESDTDESDIADSIVVQTEDYIVATGTSEEQDKDDEPAQLHGSSAKQSFELREKDLECGNDMDSDSEDDTHLHETGTPTVQSLGVSRKSRRSTLGFTALAEQFGAWSAASPAKTSHDGGAEEESAVKSMKGEGQVSKASSPNTPPVNASFFEDEMHVSRDGNRPRRNVTAEHQPAVPDSETEDPVFNDIMLVDEDVDLIQEANELSHLESKQHCTQEDSLSEASQEYGDENMAPIDPRLEEGRNAPVTPVRPVQQRVFYTTTKVPLKPAAEHTPSPVKKRSFSASRVAPKRLGTSRSASKARGHSTPTPATPIGTDASKLDIWSAVGSPARTPRKDLNPGLLRGAVVHVDVHTSEGADASGIFVELLTNMGAKCVKTWHWNPDSNTNEDSSSSKVGITHVVYKDGGKRTLEKVRRTNGVVQCVGVSWVLDCERENEWLDEAPYYIDTSLVPRGGARRRKSMEPKALANMNGTLVNNNNNNNTGRGHSTGDYLEEQPMPKTPMDRRQSAVWMHTPSDHGGEAEEDDDIEWSKFILTPVPKTPAPEAVTRYAAELLETPGGSSDEFDESPTKESIMTRTCPPKPSSRHVVAAGARSRDGEEQVMLRLMTARRKSLQFAPKIGSPLAKAWL